MIRFVSDILAPGIAAVASGGLYGVAINGIQDKAGGTTPKWTLAVPGVGVAASAAVMYKSYRVSPVTLGSYCASFSTVGWLASKMFWKRGE